jgi:hypothetical protein
MTDSEYKEAKMHLKHCLDLVGDKEPNEVQAHVIDKLKALIEEHKKLH